VTLGVDESRLDDPAALAEIDPQQMLRAIATSAAQVRAGATAAAEAGIEALQDETRPRAVVVAGMGGSGIAGDVLAALAAPAGSVPVVVHRGAGLPAWVGAADLVFAVSSSGATAETLAAADEAVRRGVRLVGVGRADSPLGDRCRNARAPFVPVVEQVAPRATLWALTTPVLVAAGAHGLVDLGPGASGLEATAVRLERLAEACRPDRESFVNPAKLLAMELAEAVPVAWGAGVVGPVAAYRFGCQLAENAKMFAVVGALPEAHHNQVVALGLAGGVGRAEADGDFFRDRVDDAEPGAEPRLVLLHDDDGDDLTARRVEVSRELAEERGVAVSVVTSEGDSALERLASLVGLVDYASAYLAIARGVDPTPVTVINELKSRLAPRPVP
jgi:glucose/mannose-6-phosphate isomerase